MSDDLFRISPSRRSRVGGPRRACARPGCPYVFAGSVSAIYCSAVCREIERREREAARKRSRRRGAAAALRWVG